VSFGIFVISASSLYKEAIILTLTVMWALLCGCDYTGIEISVLKI